MSKPLFGKSSTVLVSDDLKTLNSAKLQDLYRTYSKELESGKAVVVARKVPVVRLVPDTIYDLVVVSTDSQEWRDGNGDIIPPELNAPFVIDPYVVYEINEEKSELVSGKIVIGVEDLLDKDMDFLNDEESEDTDHADE